MNSCNASICAMRQMGVMHLPVFIKNLRIPKYVKMTLNKNEKGEGNERFIFCYRGCSWLF